MAEEKAGTVSEMEKAVNAEAASAHSRINVPLNLGNWKDVAEEHQPLLLWFHQHLLDEKLDWDDASSAIGYDRSTLFRVLKGTYEGSWSNITRSIKGYQKIVERRGTIQQAELVHNRISDMIGAGLDYALANNSITMIIGESRMGKSASAEMWRRENNHGTSVLVVAPPYGGTKLLLRRIADTIGVNRNLSGPLLYESITRAFNRNRILIIDEAHRLLPGDRRNGQTGLEIMRDLHDSTHCALALLATQRFDDNLRASAYQYEQLLGRIGMPIRLPKKMNRADFMPLLKQYITHPGEPLLSWAEETANTMGRLGILVETLKIASRLAKREEVALAEKHVFKASAMRRQMMGDKAA